MGAAGEQGSKQGHVLKHGVIEKKPNPCKQHHVTSLLLMLRLSLGLMRVPVASNQDAYMVQVLGVGARTANQ